MTFSLVLRKCAKYRSGLSPICVRLIQNGYTLYVPTKIAVVEQEWDSSKKRVRKTCTQFATINQILDKIDSKANAMKIESYSKILDLKECANELLQKKPTSKIENDDFFSFAESELTKYQEIGTYKKVKSQIHNLKEFSPVLKFSKINSDFLERYDYYLRNDKKPLVLADNSVASNLKMINRMCNAAKKKGLYNGQSVSNMIKIREKEGHKEHITMSELKILENLLYSNKLQHHLQVTLQVFIFNCYTAFRIGDLLTITKDEIQTIVIDDMERKLIVKKQSKTDNIVKVPLIENAVRIINEFESNSEFIFDVKAANKLNLQIKEVMKIANINRKFSMSSARCSTATILSNLNVPRNIVAAILGHRSVRTTEKYYIKNSNEELFRAMDKMQIDKK